MMFVADSWTSIALNFNNSVYLNLRAPTLILRFSGARLPFYSQSVASLFGHLLESTWGVQHWLMCDFVGSDFGKMPFTNGC